MTTVPRETVHRRVRNRIIEYLELASSLEDQLEYQRGAPIDVPTEVINQWQDWVCDDPDDHAWSPGVFTLAERQAMREYHRVWNQVCDDTPDPLPPLAELQQTAPWNRLREAAERCLTIFLERGKLSEVDDSQEG